MLSLLTSSFSATEQVNYAALFDAWKTQHAKAYPSAAAEAKAFRVFSANENYITEHNAQEGHTYVLGHNEFSDLTSDEFFANRLGFNATLPRAAPTGTHTYTAADLRAANASVDWTTRGAVTPVKNQGQCGSCWSFSATGAMEGAYFLASGKLTSLSEEDLVECDMVDSGCQGGLMDNAFKFVMKNGVAAEAAYPYISGTGIRGLCKEDKEAAAVGTVTGFKDVPTQDAVALQTAVAQQPVSVAVEADKAVFQHYKSGVISSKGCGTKLDHGVLVVGYGTQKTLFGSKDYWKVKNSWGPTWGDEGYLKIERGVNMCGIEMQPSYPTGAKAFKPSTVEEVA
jgi:C1A family cysteine protease